MTMIRTFIAVPVPDNVKKHLFGIQRVLQKSGIGSDIRVSWSKPSAMHLTLKFIGGIEENSIHDIQVCMLEAAESVQKFELETSGIGGFPSMSRARIIWVSLNGLESGGQKKELISLAHRLDTILDAKIGIKKEKKKYFPHLTLARAKRPMNLNRVKREFSSKSFRVSGMTLYKSTLHPSGAIHEKLFLSEFGN